LVELFRLDPAGAVEVAIGSGGARLGRFRPGQNRVNGGDFRLALTQDEIPPTALPPGIDAHDSDSEEFV
jgi:hypothetical protein